MSFCPPLLNRYEFENLEMKCSVSTDGICRLVAAGQGMIEEEMGSEFGSVIIDDVWQRQAATDGFPQAASAQNIHYKSAEVLFLLK